MNPPIEAVPCKVCGAPSSYQYVKGSFCAAHWVGEYRKTGDAEQDQVEMVKRRDGPA